MYTAFKKCSISILSFHKSLRFQSFLLVANTKYHLQVPEIVKSSKRTSAFIICVHLAGSSKSSPNGIGRWLQFHVGYF